jgi:hypothetical protein
LEPYFTALRWHGLCALQNRFGEEATVTRSSGLIRTALAAAALVVPAATASSQPIAAASAPMADAAPQRHASPPAADMAAMHKDMLSRLAATDARLDALVADMHMFTGELKIQTMAEILTLLVERQSAIDAVVSRRYQRMLGRMMFPPEPVPPARQGDVVPPDADDAEMCTPSPY